MNLPDFDIDSYVRIKELTQNGRVVSVYAGRRGWEFEVRYFHNGEAKLVYFFADELEKV